MSEIGNARAGVTLINTFSVDPADADQLIELLDKATKDVMRHIPGFVSANMHKSLDGSKIVNYAQWESADAFEAMRSNPEAGPHMKAVAEIAESFEPVLYNVVSVHD